jgi:hypothetical protein
VFAQKGRENSNSVLNSILKFVQYQKDRVDRKEITAATIRNYIKSINLFCEMADIAGAWDYLQLGHIRPIEDSVNDTGIGIDPDVFPKLFPKLLSHPKAMD